MVTKRMNRRPILGKLVHFHTKVNMQSQAPKMQGEICNFISNGILQYTVQRDSRFFLTGIIEF